MMHSDSRLLSEIAKLLKLADEIAGEPGAVQSSDNQLEATRWMVSVDHVIRMAGADGSTFSDWLQRAEQRDWAADFPRHVAERLPDIRARYREIADLKFTEYLAVAASFRDALEAGLIRSPAEQLYEATGLDPASEPADNSPFTPDEVVSLNRTLDSVEARLTQQHELGSQLRIYIEDEFEYLRSAVTRLGRRDWRNVLLSILGKLAAKVDVPMEDLVDMAKSVF